MHPLRLTPRFISFYLVLVFSSGAFFFSTAALAQREENGMLSISEVYSLSEVARYTFCRAEQELLSAYEKYSEAMLAQESFEKLAASIRATKEIMQKQQTECEDAAKQDFTQVKEIAKGNKELEKVAKSNLDRLNEEMDAMCEELKSEIKRMKADPVYKAMKKERNHRILETLPTLASGVVSYSAGTSDVANISFMLTNIKNSVRFVATIMKIGNNMKTISREYKRTSKLIWEIIHLTVDYFALFGQKIDVSDDGKVKIMES